MWTDNNPVAHIQTAELGVTEQRWVGHQAPFDLDCWSVVAEWSSALDSSSGVARM